METFTAILDLIVEVAIHGFDLIGVIIIVIAGIQGFVNYLKRSPRTRLQLAQGMALGLEFKLGSEILRTVIVRDLSEVGLVAAIIAVRAALTFLIHWEIRNEKEEERREEGERNQA